jgi:hypothetical protein
VSTKSKVIAGVVAVALVAAGVIAWSMSGSSASTHNSGVIIVTRVQPRTLQSTVQLGGTLSRKNLRNVTATSEGLVTGMRVKDGSVGRAGRMLFALNGRHAIAENGTTAFYRSLTLGDIGPDVLQLKQILAAAGYYPGPMDDLFTQQTQFALAQWQAQNDYPNATPASPQAVTVALAQGAGYQLGSQTSAGLIIGPPSAQTVSAVTGGGAGAGAAAPVHATLASYVSPRIDPTPTLTIQSVASQVNQGQVATFVITASSAPTAAVTVNLGYSGTAGSGDIIAPPLTAQLQAGATQTSVSVQTRVNTTVGSSRTIVAMLEGGSGYTVGAPGSAQTSIANNNVPELTISGGTTVSPGGTATLTVTANQAPLTNTEVFLSLAGSAQAGTDYNPPNPVVNLAAGTTSASFTVSTLNSQVLGPNKYIVVSLTASPGNYSVGNPGAAVVTIGANSSLPTLTLSSATTYLQKGQPYTVSVGLSQAVSRTLTVNLSYGGNAVEGADYVTPAGGVQIPPGQTSFAVTIPTVSDNKVESNRLLTVALAASSAYRIGSPSSTAVLISSQVLPKLTLSANTGVISQGGAASFTITADQAPAKDTSVSFTVQGTAQPGQDYVPMTGAALLRAGQTSVTVQLQSITSSVSFEPTDMIVGNWPIRVGTVYVKTGNPVQPGTPIIELTEPDLSVTLQASASNRGNLRVGQSCTVQISGGENQVQGTITQLDSTPTNVGQGGQSNLVYEGRVDSPNLAELNGTDGAQVSITAVDQQVTNAPSVPIAAVKQNGLGADVVRVIGPSGRVTEVRVTTGLSEGSYIAIKRGLQIGQTVIVQSDSSS